MGQFSNGHPPTTNGMLSPLLNILENNFAMTLIKSRVADIEDHRDINVSLQLVARNDDALFFQKK